MGTYYEESIIDSKLIKKHKLNNFDNKKLHNFIKISFKNLPAYNKNLKIFYQDITIGNYFERKLIKKVIFMKMMIARLIVIYMKEIFHHY